MKSKKDAIHDACVRAARELGVSVFDTHRLGRFYDTVWGWGWMSLIVEIKSGDAKLRDTQIEDAKAFFPHGRIAVVRSVDDALALALWLREVGRFLANDAVTTRCPVKTI